MLRDRPPCGRPVAPATRRPVAGDEGVLGVHRGLIDGEPPAHPTPEPARDELDVAGEMRDVAPHQPAAGVGEPCGVGEMVQRDHRLHAARAQGLDHLAVMIDRGQVPGTLARLDPAPFDREPMGVVAPRPGQIEILLEQLVVPAGIAGPERQLAGLLERPPVVRAIAAFDLMRGRGGTPQEAGRKTKGRFGGRRRVRLRRRQLA